jgi:hypothetical protein
MNGEWNVILSRVMAKNLCQNVRDPSLHLHCTTLALAGSARERSAVQVMLRVTDLRKVRCKCD